MYSNEPMTWRFVDWLTKAAMQGQVGVLPLVDGPVSTLRILSDLLSIQLQCSDATLVVLHSFPGSLETTLSLPYKFTPVEVELPAVLLPADTFVHMSLYSRSFQHFVGSMQENRETSTLALDQKIRTCTYLSLVGCFHFLQVFGMVLLLRGQLFWKENDIWRHLSTQTDFHF